MADNPTPKPPPGAPVPPLSPAHESTAANPSTEGVRKPGQGEVPPSIQGVPVTEKTAPGVVTSKSESPFKLRQKELEKQLKAQSDDRSRAAAGERAQIRAQIEELELLDARRGQGANPRTPRGNLLMADAMQEAYPDLHLRFVNEVIPGRPELLASVGYKRLGNPGGDLVLWGMPREQWVKGEMAKREETERNLRLATSGAKADAIQKLQKAFDEAGINYNARDLVTGRD